MRVNRDIIATQRAMLQEVSVELIFEELWRRMLQGTDRALPFDAREDELISASWKGTDAATFVYRRCPPVGEEEG